MAKIQPIILAAGNGKRIIAEAMAKGMGELPKVLYPLQGRPLIDYVLDEVAAAAKLVQPDGIELLKPIVVVKFMQELVREHLGERVSYVEQNPAPLGTGHAVLVTETAVPTEVDQVLVLNGDMPAWQPTTIAKVLRQAAHSKSTLTLATVDFTDPHFDTVFFAYGRIIRDSKDRLLKIVEQRDTTEQELKISECNPSLYCFDRSWVFAALHQLKNDNSQHEYYLTDLLGMAIEQGQAVETVPVADWREALGVNTLEQLQLTEKLLR
ncbi:MAG: NTP transferase domain-containing protein [bacterium]|nr:NTP transferase domain-containing protein [bacterium]